MSKPHVYLAGPIAGCTESEANDWRDMIFDQLQDVGIIGVSPLRCEPIHGPLYGTGYPDERFGTARAIASKNLLDVTRCDLTVCYFPSNKVLSKGTLIELAWAHALGKPTILVTEDPSLIEHPVVQANASWVVPTLEDAVDIIVGVLEVYV